MDKDMKVIDYGNMRGDGVQGQIENISVMQAVGGHAYSGKVAYYGGSGNAPFTLVVSGTDLTGRLNVYAYEVVDTHTSGDYVYGFTFPA